MLTMQLLHVLQLVEEIDGFGRRQIIARELGNQLVLTNQMLFTQPDMAFHHVNVIFKSHPQKRSCPLLVPAVVVDGRFERVVAAYLNAYLYTARLLSSVTRTHSRSSLRD